VDSSYGGGVINGIGHYWGYRNFASSDASKNIVPWGILIGGEELHNNHHAYGTSAKLSSRWYEFDLGWTYIRILETLGLAQVRNVAPTLRSSACRQGDARRRYAQAVIANRYAVATAYARTLKATCTELARLRERAGRSDFADVPSMRRLKRWLSATSSCAARA
jgi:stearoyl-CoA desaturase (delta-9 desaturase)